MYIARPAMRNHLATLIDDFRRYDHEIAVVRYHGNRRRVTTYGELARLAGRFAALLEARGIRAGERVLIWGENGAEWMGAFYGCMLRGVLAVPLDATGSAEFAARVCADVAPKLAVGDAGLLRQLNSRDPRSENPGLGRPMHPGNAGPSTASAAADFAQDDRFGGNPCPPTGGFFKLNFEDFPEALPGEEAGAIDGITNDTPLQILFTSGTTGNPKGIVHTHGNLLASMGPIEDAAQPYLRYEWLIHPLRILHTLPLSHVFGQMMGLWVPHIFRAELHFESRLVAPRLIETIRRERISVLAAVPRVLALLRAHLEAAMPGLAERVAASDKMSAWGRWWHFRHVHRAFGIKFWALISGGGVLPGPLEQFWNALGFVLVQGYGMTETTALITLNHPFHVARGTIGKPIAGREVKLGPDGEVLVRGASISGATWSGGELHRRESEWLATGDLAETAPTGELRFVGRKSETIVTGAGVNVHPEDLEAAIEQQAGVAACAVVPVETPAGPEPCAVVAMRGTGGRAQAAIDQANAQLADFQRVRRWVLWPEPDLPRTASGKVRRTGVAEWLANAQSSNGAGGRLNGDRLAGERTDWLLGLIAQITGEEPPGAGDELRLSEDLHLDSLGRVQLAAAIEERLGTSREDGLLDEAHTVGDLRSLLAAQGDAAAAAEMQDAGSSTPLHSAQNDSDRGGVESAADRDVRYPTLATEKSQEDGAPIFEAEGPSTPPLRIGPKYVYPHWPWWGPVRWLRVAFLELIAQPLVRLLARPAVIAPELPPGEPMLIVANHVTTYDGPLIEYALPGRMRRHIAVAMSAEMLDDFRHFRNPETGSKRFYLPGPLFYLLMTALYNVFPLPRLRDFQRSFDHAGEALDRGYNVMVFPEGTRSSGALARFRPGIGLLVRQSSAPVLPVAIRGLGELKARGRGWFRSGTIEVRVGRPIRFGPEETEAAIAARLHDAVETLLRG